jgi:excisionase family DNA binding protein
MHMRRLGGYLKPWAAARYLGIPVEEVQKMLESGELPGVKIEGQWRIPLERLEEWLDEEVSQEELKKLAEHIKSVDPKKVESFFEEASQKAEPPSD